MSQPPTRSSRHLCATDACRRPGSIDRPPRYMAQGACEAVLVDLENIGLLCNSVSILQSPACWRLTSARLLPRDFPVSFAYANHRVAVQCYALV
jgi:hypothetical protein